MITLLQLDYFRKLAAMEHITKTARELQITQTALSAMIISLEKELGTQLFDRSKQRIRLNDAGRLYLEYVNASLAALENGRIALQEMRPSLNQEVRLGTGAASVWSPLFHDFCKSFPQYTLKQHNYPIPQLEKALLDMTVDFVTAGECDLSVKGMERTWIKTDSIYLCVSPTHPLANRESVYMEELVDENFIALNKNAPLSAFCDAMFLRAGYTPNIVAECDYALRPPLITSNFGVALTSSSAQDVDLFKPNKYIRVADNYATRNMYLYHNPRRNMSDAASVFLDFCVNYYKTKS